MKPLKQGDPCRVRLSTGEVVQAVYDGEMQRAKHHFVLVSGVSFSAGKYGACMFVGNPCELRSIDQ